MLTKQDLLEIAEILNKSELKDSVDKLTAANTELLNKVTDVEAKVTALDQKFTTETGEIRSELDIMAKFSRDLEETVTNNKTEIEAELTTLRNEVVRLADSTNSSEKLAKKVERLEKSVHHGQQHDRLWNLEIAGIPTHVGDEPEKLEEAALAIFGAIDVNCSPSNIEAIHRLKDKGNGRAPVTILCIDNRKIVREIHQNKRKLKHLKDLNIDIPGLNDQSKIFINPSLTPYTRSLAYNCRLLRDDGLIEKVRVDDDGSIKIKLVGREQLKRINVESDLTNMFGDYGKYTFL